MPHPDVLISEWLDRGCVRRVRNEKTGPRKGANRESKLGSGQTRTIKSLDEVYDRQGPPPRGSLSDGERKMIEESGTKEFKTSLDTMHVIAKKRKQTAEIAIDAV